MTGRRAALALLLLPGAGSAAGQRELRAVTLPPSADAALLAGFGLFSLMAYSVAQRRREIGIRIALGARRADIISMVLREGLSLTLIGSAMGLIIAAAVSRVLAGYLFGIPPIDPVTFAGTTVVFAAIGLAACYGPARRATRIDAMEALRYE